MSLKLPPQFMSSLGYHIRWGGIQESRPAGAKKLATDMNVSIILNKDDFLVKGLDTEKDDILFTGISKRKFYCSIYTFIHALHS